VSEKEEKNTCLFFRIAADHESMTLRIPRLRICLASSLVLANTIARPRPTRASGLAVGLGVSSVYSGRMVPVLGTVVWSSSMALSLNSSGVRSRLYSHEVAQAALFYRWESPAFFGTVVGGMGLGIARSLRTYRSSEARPWEKADEKAAGMAALLSMQFPGNFHLTMEGLYAKGPRSVFLVFKPFAQFSTGVFF